MGKNRRIKGGGSKNSNKCSVFPAAYKLVHLHTNLIFKHSIQNLQNTTKSPFSHHPIQKSQYRTKYRQTQLKSTLLPIQHTKSKPTIQTTFFLYKYENPKKIPIFTDYQLFIKNHINNIKNFTLISNSKREYKNVIKITPIKIFKLKRR